MEFEREPESSPLPNPPALEHQLPCSQVQNIERLRQELECAIQTEHETLPVGYLPIESLDTEQVSPDPFWLGEVTHPLLTAMQVDDATGLRYASTNHWAHELGVVRHTVTRTVEGCVPFAEGTFRGKRVRFWSEDDVRPLLERNLTPPPGYGEVEYLEEYQGQPVGERVGTSKAWERAGLGKFLYRHLLDTPSLLTVRYANQDVAVWTESQVRSALAVHEAQKAKHFRGGIAPYLQGDSTLYGSATAWAESLGHSYSVPLRSALREIEAETQSIPRKQDGAVVGLYSEHAVDAAAYFSEQRSRLNYDVQLDPETFEVHGTVDAWCATFGRDYASLWKALRPFVGAPAKTVVTRGEPQRPLFSYTQVAAVAQPDWLSQPEWRSPGGPRLVLPSGAVYRRLQWSQASKWRDRLRSVTALNPSNHATTYYLEEDVERCGGVPLEPLTETERAQYASRQNPHAASVEALRRLVDRGVQLRQDGVLTLNVFGVVKDCDRIIAPGSVLRQLLRQQSVTSEDIDALMSSQAPHELYVVQWPGHWARPLTLPLYDVVPILDGIKARQVEPVIARTDLRRDGSVRLAGQTMGTPQYWFERYGKELPLFTDKLLQRLEAADLLHRYGRTTGFRLYGEAEIERIVTELRRLKGISIE